MAKNKKSPSTSRNDKVSELAEAIRSMGYTQGLNTVFTTFLEITATALACATNHINKAKREERYAALTENMTPEILNQYAELEIQLFQAIQSYKDDPIDILGAVYHELNLNNEWNGQFFTPDNISRLMAEIVDVGNREGNTSDEPILINEPTCGSGTMVIASAWSMLRKGIDYTTRCLFVAEDIDIRCVWMTYIQLTLYRIPAIIIHGNTLTAEEWDRWYTPYFYCLNRVDSEQVPSATKEAEARQNVI